jgi:hypothetical protein
LFLIRFFKLIAVERIAPAPARIGHQEKTQIIPLYSNPVNTLPIGTIIFTANIPEPQGIAPKTGYRPDNQITRTGGRITGISPNMHRQRIVQGFHIEFPGGPLQRLGLGLSLQATGAARKKNNKAKGCKLVHSQKILPKLSYPASRNQPFKILSDMVT